MARAVVALIQGTHTGHFTVVSDHRIERRVEITDEVRNAVGVGVDTGRGRRIFGLAPAHFESVGKKIAVRIGTVWESKAGRAPNVNIAIGVIFSLALGQILFIRLIDIDQAVMVIVVT